MKDRVPLYPGRVKMVPVAGQTNVYDMTRADSPQQEGTPLNKASLLSDEMAALLGLGDDAVPNDALAELYKLRFGSIRNLIIERIAESKTWVACEYPQQQRPCNYCRRWWWRIWVLDKRQRRGK